MVITLSGDVSDLRPGLRMVSRLSPKATDGLLSWLDIVLEQNLLSCERNEGEESTSSQQTTRPNKCMGDQKQIA